MELENLTREQEEILIGHLLGDGSLIKKNKNSIKDNARFSIDRSERDSKYLEWTKNIFNYYCSNDVFHYSRDYYINNIEKTYKFASFSTRSLPLFTKYYNIWYPNGNKVIPNNLILTPRIVATWICDDGHIRVRGKNKDCLYIRICSEGFSKQENEFLAKLLTDFCGEKILCQKLNKNSDKYRLVAYNVASRAIVKKINNFMPDGMERKNIWSNIDIENNFYKLRSSNLVNRINLSINDKIAIESLLSFDKLTSIEAAEIINSSFKDKKMPIMTHEYSIKYVYNLYKKNLLNREKVKGKKFLYFVNKLK